MDDQHGSADQWFDDLGRTETAWHMEARAMCDMGVVTRTIALELPTDSDLRDELLVTAERWLQCARLRGVAPTLRVLGP